MVEAFSDDMYLVKVSFASSGPDGSREVEMRSVVGDDFA
jgi:hypothetical protein